MRLLKQSWAQNKDDRPDFKYISSVLTDIYSAASEISHVVMPAV